MPHGALTPLGRQFRTLLANVRPVTHQPCALRGPQAHHGRTWAPRAPGRAWHQKTSSSAAVATAATSDAWYNDPIAGPPPPDPPTDHTGPSKRTSNRRTRRSYLTEALRNAGKTHAIPPVPTGKNDLSYISLASPRGWRAHTRNAERHRLDYAPSLARTTDLTLERLVASCLQHASTPKDAAQARWNASYQLTFRESSFLSDHGYSKSDIEAWARLVSMQDSLAAADAFVGLVESGSRKHVPMFMLTFLLRRHYLKPRALRALLDIVPKLLESLLSRTGRSTLSDTLVFVISVRLIRHARKVWPAGMPTIAELILTYLSKAFLNNDSRLSRMTSLLNKTMGLLSLETAVSPFQDTTCQERAIVMVLRFMTEHQPQLHITRDGYRAVVRVQLAQKKTPSEQQWAGLKTLSWPPWKQNRTAMDAGITAETHGITNAAATLRSMREAGYRPTQWERTAELLAGWDTDGTPAIQIRALLGTGFCRIQSNTAIWAARIAATRTAQEAWAAYLAFEDAQLPVSDSVHLAILQKLHGEEKRERAADKSNSVALEQAGRRPRLLPGDMKEVQPLPPSTHLYTYTRSPVPTVDRFIRHLLERGVPLRNRALAFVVANAASRRLGFSYLKSRIAEYPGIANLLSLGYRSDTRDVPDTVFAAYLRLLCRYSNVPLTDLDRDPRSVSIKPHRKKPFLLDGKQVNPYHPLVFALELLHSRGTTSQPPFNAVLRALSQDATLASMRFLRTADTVSGTESDKTLEHNRGAILAYSLVRSTISTLHGSHVDLDSEGVHYLYLAAENATIACWAILRSDIGLNTRSPCSNLQDRTIVREASDLLRRRYHFGQLKVVFRILVGGFPEPEPTPPPAEPGTPPATPNLPSPSPRPLLQVPRAALLHAYVRALGWAAEHAALLELVRWMARYSEELQAQWARERNGADMLRLTIVALRVFLERSWLDDDSVQGPDDDNASRQREGDECAAASISAADARLRHLRVLERAASAELVAEMRGLLDGVGGWPWATDEEVARYCRNERFGRIRGLTTVA